MQARMDLLAKAKAKREEEKKEQASKGGVFDARPRSEYCALGHDQFRVVRLLGNPLSVRGQEGTTDYDACLAYMATVVDDQGKRARLVFPEYQSHKSWILWRIYDTVMEYKWIDDPASGKGHRQYKNATLHPECFQRVALNNNTDASRNKFEKGWKPTAYVNINVIDRDDEVWHEKNHHSKLLSNQAFMSKTTGNLIYDPGIKKPLYDYIWDSVVAYEDGPWDTYDIAIKTLSVNPWYSVFSGHNDYMKLDDVVKSKVHQGALTEEEQAYEQYSLTDMFRITPYIRIQKKLGDFIRKVDVDFGTHFTADLDKLCTDEQAEFASKGLNKWGYKSDDIGDEDGAKDIPKESVVGTQPVAPQAPAPSFPQQQSVSIPQQAPVIPTRASRTPSIPSGSVDWEGLANGNYGYKAVDGNPTVMAKYNGAKVQYKGVPLLTPEEKALVVGIDANGQFLYAKADASGNKLELSKDSEDGFVTPMLFHCDPLLGTLY